MCAHVTMTRTYHVMSDALQMIDIASPRDPRLDFPLSMDFLADGLSGPDSVLSYVDSGSLNHTYPSDLSLMSELQLVSHIVQSVSVATLCSPCLERDAWMVVGCIELVVMMMERE